jgi:hypothetical protein
MTREVLQQALEAYIKAGNGNSTDFYLQGVAYDLGIEALAEQDAEAHLQAVSDFGQLQEQEPWLKGAAIGVPFRRDKAPLLEPVAWMTQAGNFTHPSKFTKAEAELYGWQPLFTAPPKRQPLTTEQIDEIFMQVIDDYEAGKIDFESHGLARAIEAAHDIGDNT